VQIFLFHTNFFRRHCMSYRVSSNFLFMVGTLKSMLFDLMKIILVKGIYTLLILNWLWSSVGSFIFLCGGFQYCT
jgi:hypothetical protein